MNRKDKRFALLLKLPLYLWTVLFVLAALTSLLCALIGYPFGYLMARLKPASRSIVTLLLVVPFWTNSLIRIYGWRILLIGNGPINTLLMHLGWIQQPLKLLNTEGAVFLGMVYALVPFMILPDGSLIRSPFLSSS